ncbi:MAG: beta-propeller domain-containing protein, partial [Pseudomonadota bacterium]
LIYDIKDPKAPKRVSRVPVYGYPIEMFIQGNTVYALIRDALYLTQEKGVLKFERHNVSQLVAIDVSDQIKPKILQTIDIVGNLREGVSRKIEDTIYVVSYIPRYYQWGWSYNALDEKEQATVYAFNVADPKNLNLVDELKIFEGGSYEYHDKNYNSSFTRQFNDVTISATSNTLMVVENWSKWGYINGLGNNCGSYVNLQEAVVSLVDISDPTGKIQLHTKFETSGQLGDQFKQTYVYDSATGKAAYLGIFARQEWNSSNCESSSLVLNTLESWDVTDGENPTKLDELAFGKPNETVRGSAFDSDRKVAFAITAERIDPLYAISFGNLKDLKILSEVNGLSGDMSVFRFIGDNKFLVAIGRDNSDACTGFDNPSTGWSTQVAVSIIDVQDLDKIRLVQRKCVAVKNASFVSSELNWNLDQAHKMIGMHSDGEVNVITVPVYYYTKSDNDGWWWYRDETAVGLMTWDLSQYDPTKNELDQNVLQNFGTIIHPNGQVKRSIVFTHQGAEKRRMVINLSDTHISLVDIQDLEKPDLQSIVEIAPYHHELFRFGNHLVEHVQLNPNYYYEGNENASLFRVKPIGGQLDDTTPIASFTVGQVQRVVKFKQNLVLFRQIPVQNPNEKYYSWESEIVIYDLSDPANPVMAGSKKLPGPLMPYYWYWCGMDAYWGGYWFDYYSGGDGWTLTDNGLVFLDLQDISAPAVESVSLNNSDDLSFFELIPNPEDLGSFYLTYRHQIGQIEIDGTKFNQYKYYAQRWKKTAAGWTPSGQINVPGRTMKIWNAMGETLFLTYDFTYKHIWLDDYETWQPSFRINFLRKINPSNNALAELLDLHMFANSYLKGIVVDNTKLFVNAQPDYYSYAYADSYQTPNLSWENQSDTLSIFDLSDLKLDEKYSEPTGTYSVQMMGTYKGRLFLNLPGDGVLAVDVSDPTQPVGEAFVRTLGYATHIEFVENAGYIAAGYFGVYQLNLGKNILPSL